MSWVRIDDGVADHAKMLAAGAEACWLWVCGLAYCNRQQVHDGFIPREKVAVLFPVRSVQKLVDALVRVGLWEVADGGYFIAVDDRIYRFAALDFCESVRLYRAHKALVYERDGRQCRYCGRSDVQLSLDHVVPRSRGGPDDGSNLVAACLPCNSRKGARTPAEAGMALRVLP